MVSALKHPAICTLYDVGEQEGTHFLVMEYLEGETLAARLARGPLPLDQALELGIGDRRALAAAHARGIVHRDLKPANIMLTKDGAEAARFRAREAARGEPRLRGSGCEGDGLGTTDGAGRNARNPSVHGAGTGRGAGS